MYGYNHLLIYNLNIKHFQLKIVFENKTENCMNEIQNCVVSKQFIYIFLKKYEVQAKKYKIM